MTRIHETEAAITVDELHRLISGIIDVPAEDIVSVAIAIITPGGDILTGSTPDQTVNASVLSRVLTSHLMYLALKSPE